MKISFSEFFMIKLDFLTKGLCLDSKFKLVILLTDGDFPFGLFEDEPGLVAQLFSFGLQHSDHKVLPLDVEAQTEIVEVAQDVDRVVELLQAAQLVKHDLWWGGEDGFR